MLKRVCDRCFAEMPMGQMLEQDELILRRLNEKPFDLCEECQTELKEWFDPQKWFDSHVVEIPNHGVTIDSDGTTPDQMISKDFDVLQFVTRCKDCRFYDPRGQRCASLSFTVAPDFWCKHGKKADVSVNIGGTDDTGNNNAE